MVRSDIDLRKLQSGSASSLSVEEQRKYKDSLA